MSVNFNKPIIVRDFRNGSWFWIQTHVWRDNKLNPSDKTTYGTLASYANTQQEMYPGIHTIGKDSGLSDRQVYRCIKVLEKLGYIEIIRNNGKANIYRLLKTTPEMKTPLTHSHTTPDKSTLGTPDKSTLRTISNITISNNNRETPSNKYSSLKSLTQEDLQEIAIKYKVSVGFVVLEFEKLRNYCEAKGKKYKNYKSALRNFVLGDMQRVIERRNNVGKQGIDARNL